MRASRARPITARCHRSSSISQSFSTSRRLHSLTLLGASALLRARSALALAELTDVDGQPLSDQDIRLAEQNERAQELNNGPSDLPTFARNKYNVKVVVRGNKYHRDDASDNKIIVKDYVEGNGPVPQDDQEVEFNYTAFVRFQNESGRLIDTSFRRNRPAKVRLGANALIPGCEKGLKSMRVGGKRRIVVPPEEGPPTGPNTFFSAKQWEVFDIELLAARPCQREQRGMISRVVCGETSE